jgi:hypothetical protein
MHILHLSFLSKQDYGYVSNKGLHFQMVGPMCSSPNNFGASGSGELPPPPPMMPSEAFMATQTEVLRQILQMQQQIAQQLNQRPPHGANQEGPNHVITYAQFIGMKPRPS